MNTDEIKQEVLTKLSIEREVREQLARQQGEQRAPGEKGKWAWLESKFALLLLGAIISGVLVPTFQYTQERVKWHQQNRYDSLVLQLTNMRESLKQFIAVQALSSELYEIGLDVLQAPAGSLDTAQLEQWRKDLRALQQRRIGQNAAFAASIFYFPPDSQLAMRAAWNDLIGHSEEMHGLIYGVLETSAKSDNSVDRNELATQLGENLSKVNGAYDQLLTMLRQQLLEVDRETSRFR